MTSLLNTQRPPVFCPGCGHERVVHALDKAFIEMGLAAHEIVMVSDIGCSGLFDTFFNTHAFHGLHGRALTYATGIKMARPDLTVVVTMGDGGLGIGGAHVLSTCRRNIDITLLVLNNFNYGMTGGQCSSTTPADAQVGSGFLNRLEKPIDIGQIAGAAGAGWVDRISAYAGDLTPKIRQAIDHDGFSLLDIWGICPGRYTRRNRITPKSIAEQLSTLPKLNHFGELNQREEYGRAYRTQAAGTPSPGEPSVIEIQHQAPQAGRREVVILGSAGQRILTAGELICIAGATAGLYASQKNDYPITVMRGHSVCELILSDTPIDYTGIQSPDVVIALAQEGVDRRRKQLERLKPTALVIKAAPVALPQTAARIVAIDFKTQRFKSTDWAVAALACLAGRNVVLNSDMLDSALEHRFKGEVLQTVRAVAAKAGDIYPDSFGE